jgi:hypothetical protein
MTSNSNSPSNLILPLDRARLRVTLFGPTHVRHTEAIPSLTSLEENSDLSHFFSLGSEKPPTFTSPNQDAKLAKMMKVPQCKEAFPLIINYEDRSTALAPSVTYTRLSERRCVTPTWLLTAF